MDKLLECMKVMHEAKDDVDHANLMAMDESNRVLSAIIKADKSQDGSNIKWEDESSMMYGTGGGVEFNFINANMSDGIDYLMEYSNFKSLFESLGWKVDPKDGWHFFASKVVDLGKKGTYELIAESKDGRLYITVNKK